MLSHKIILFGSISRELLRYAVAVCIIAIITSCASVDSRFKEATKKDTVWAYDKFLKQYPDSKYTEDAKERRKQAKLKEDARRAKWKKEEEQRKKRLAERKKQIEKQKKQLSELAKNRINSGESVPQKPTDPGFPIVFCEIPNVSNAVFDKVLSVEVPYSKSSSLFDIGFESYICGNTSPGKEVMRWRQWYCKDAENVYDCVAGKWENDEPTFSGVASEQKEIIKLRKGEPDVRYRRIQLN